MHSTRTEDVIAVLAGTQTEAEVASKHGVSEAEVREWRRMMADGLSVQTSARRSRRWVALGVVVAAMLGSTLAYAQVTCMQTLPPPMKTFCQDSPAIANDVNANFQQLVTWSRQKLGNEGTADISAAGNLFFGNATRQMVNLWSNEYGIGVQPNTTYFRSSFNFAWFRGGAHADTQFAPGTGGVLAMKLDNASNLTVTGGVSAAGLTSTGDIVAANNISASGNITAAGQLQGGTIRQTACGWVSTGLPITADNVVHSVICPSGYYQAGWQCRASDKLDGDCYIWCCRP